MPPADRFTITFSPPEKPTHVKVCIAWTMEPAISDDTVFADMSFTPSGGRGVEFTATDPCVEVPIPEGAETVTVHDLTEPQWSIDATAIVP